MNVFELFGTIAIDNSGAERSLDKTVGHARDTESKLERTFKNIGKVIAAAFAIDKIKDFGKACTEAYASIAAEESAFAQIMGDYADTAQKKLEAVSDATGITATRMTTHMTSLTAKFKGLGYNVEDATTLATDGLMIAADAAAFWDMSLDESMSHLNSFINGSYEGGEAIGLFANDTQMAAYAVEKGIVADAKAWAALDEATKQATRLDYAKKMMESSGATGQAAKEAGAYANVMAELKEAWRQFQGVIGKPILEKLVLPAMQKLIKFMPGLTEAVQGGIDWLLEAFDKVASYFSEVFTEDGLNMAALPAAFANMFRDVARAVPRWLASIGRTLKNAWTNIVWPAVQGVAAKIGIDLPEWSEIEQKVRDWWDGGNGIKKEIANVCNWTLNMFGAPADVTPEDVSQVLGSWWAGAQTAIQSACTWTLQLFQNPTEQIGKVQQEVLKWWSYAKHWVSSVCKWALNLFGVPEARVEAVTNLVNGWWIGMKGAAQDALKWTLQLFQNPEETAGEIATKVSTWWAGIVNAVKGACKWTLQLFGFEEDAVDKAALKVKQWFSGVVKTVGSALTLFYDWASGKDAETIKGDAETLFNDAKALLGNTMEIVWNLIPPQLQEAIGGLIESLQTFWAENKETFGTIFDSRTGLFSTLINGLSSLLSDNEFVSAITTAISAFMGAIQAIATALTSEAGKATLAALLDMLVSVLNLIHPLLALIEPVLSLLAPAIQIVAGVIEAIADALSWLTGGGGPDTPEYGMSLDLGNGVKVALTDEQAERVRNGENAYDVAGIDQPTVPTEEEAAETKATYDDWAARNAGYLKSMVYDAATGAYRRKTDEELKTEFQMGAEMYYDLVETLESKGITPEVNGWYEELLNMYRNGGGGGGGNAGMVDGLYTRGSGLPMPEQSNGMLTAMMQAFATVKDDVVAATQEGVVNGLSGVTITGHITTGDVKLNDNAIIGSIWPKLDLKLGWATGMQGRG